MTAMLRVSSGFGRRNSPDSRRGIRDRLPEFAGMDQLAVFGADDVTFCPRMPQGDEFGHDHDHHQTSGEHAATKAAAVKPTHHDKTA
jgi:hypothetical protein